MPPVNYFARGLALFYTGLSQHMAGKTVAAKRLLRENLEQGTAASAVASVRLLLGLCIIQQDSLNLEQLQPTAESLLRQSEAGGFLVSKAWGHMFLGRVSYEANDLEIRAVLLAGAELEECQWNAGHECLAGWH
jgi:hypothetical protein